MSTKVSLPLYGRLPDISGFYTDLVPDPEPAVGGGRPVDGDPQHEEGHGVELAPAADAEAEAAHAAVQLHRVVLVVQLQQVQLVVLLRGKKRKLSFEHIQSSSFLIPLKPTVELGSSGSG